MLEKQSPIHGGSTLQLTVPTAWCQIPQLTLRGLMVPMPRLVKAVLTGLNIKRVIKVIADQYM